MPLTIYSADGSIKATFAPTTIDLTSQVTGVLPVPNGGTGDSSIAAHAMLIGNGVNPLLTLAPGAAANYARSNGTDWASAALAAADLTGTLPASAFPALTGDVTTSAGALATTLATVNSNVGTFTGIPSITANGKGLITAISANNKYDAWIASDFADVTGGTGPVDFYTHTLDPGKLAHDGDFIESELVVSITSTANNKTILISFGGTTIDTISIPSGLSGVVQARIIIMRDSSSSVRCVIYGSVASSLAVVYATVTGLTLSNSQVLKFSSASNQFTARMAFVRYTGAA